MRFQWRRAGHPCSLWTHIWIVSTWSGDGHFHASHRTYHSQTPERNQTQAAVPPNRGEAADRRRDLVEGASVARVALSHGVNANQVFGWRKLYLAGELGSASRAIKLLPVHVSENSPSLAPTTHRECSPSVELAKSTPGTIHLELRHAQVRIEGSADPALLRVLLECLRR